jgi:Icc-related predicted phosphoesterase
MKVLFLTDVHTSRPALEWTRRSAGSYDAVIVGGDLARGGGAPDFVTEFLDACVSSCQRVLFVHGNADPPDVRLPDDVLSLHGRTAKLGNATIGGLGGSNETPFHTIFELDDGSARSVLSRVGKVDILVSHCPPLNTRCDRAGDRHIGSAPVREYVLRERPTLVLSGHAHESKAVDKLGDTTIVNAGPLMHGNYAEIRLVGPISVELKNESI